MCRGVSCHAACCFVQTRVMPLWPFFDLRATCEGCRGHTRLVAEMLAHFEGSDGPSEEGGMVYQLLHAENSQGYTPLHLAAARTDQSTAALLLEWGANPLVKNKAGKTALDISPDDGEIATALRSALKAAQGCPLVLLHPCCPRYIQTSGRIPLSLPSR